MAFRPDLVSGYRIDASLRFGIFWTLVGTLILIWAAAMRAQRTVRPSKSRRAAPN
jgi:hypothetical protein